MGAACGYRKPVDWRPPPSEQLLRRRPLRALATPVRERRFTYDAYAAFLDRLRDANALLVPLRELASADAGDRPVVGLRHDVDERLDSALTFARLEAERGIRSTYFVLHTASYWPDRRMRELQELGHEVGLHNDALTVHARAGADPVDTLRRELDHLRRIGLDVTGVAGHGSREARERRFLNHLVFSDLPAEAPRFPNNDLRGALEPPASRATLDDLDLVYDADFLDVDAYFADSYADARGRRWHPDKLELRGLRPRQKTVILTHPCLWDEHVAAKAARTLARGAFTFRRR